MKGNILKDSLFFSLTWDYLNVYLPSQNQNSSKTVKAYCDALTIFRRYVTDICHIPIEKYKFEDLTYDFLLDYRNYLVSSGYKARTVNHRITVISAYMKYAALRKTELLQIYMNISEVPYIKEPSNIREIIEDDEAIAMLLAAPGKSKTGIRDTIILTILYDTAIRVDELTGLHISDVNLATELPYLRILGKGSKERIVALSEKTVPLIKQYTELYHHNSRDKSSPFIYTVIKGKKDRMSERNIERIVKKYGDVVRLKKPNIPMKIYPHMLRRTRVSGWYRDGVPIETIAVILGHVDSKTTRKSYAKPSVEMLRKEMEKGYLPENKMIEEKPLWKDDLELAHFCGLR